MKLLDSDTCIGILRGRESVLQHRAAEVDEVATTWVTASELFYGATKSTKPDLNAAVVVRFLHTVPVLAPDLASARIFGEVKARLAAASRGASRPTKLPPRKKRRGSSNQGTASS